MPYRRGDTGDPNAVGGFDAYAMNSASLPSRWMVAAALSATALTTSAPAANTMRALPFVAPRGARLLTDLAIEVTTLQAGNARLGVYENKADNDIYPGTLLLDAGTVSVGTTGLKQIGSLILPVTPGRLYWIAYVSDVAPTLRALSASQVFPILGWVSTIGAVAGVPGYTVAFTYGTLPTPFTGGGAAMTSVYPALAYRLST